ncbi:hypothetical protein KAJ89_04250 [Candidatus Parcubacteria bacterium]|nr:hypothetical protein [Candidatus Parcubacteria bacterium]
MKKISLSMILVIAVLAITFVIPAWALADSSSESESIADSSVYFNYAPVSNTNDDRTEILSNIQPTDPVAGLIGSAGAIIEMGKNILVYYAVPGFSKDERLTSQQLKDREKYFIGQELGRYYKLGPNNGYVHLLSEHPRQHGDKRVGYGWFEPVANAPRDIVAEYAISKMAEKIGQQNGKSRAVVVFEGEYLTTTKADSGGASPGISGILGNTAAGIAPGYGRAKNITRIFKINVVHVYMYNPGPVTDYYAYYANLKNSSTKKKPASTPRKNDNFQQVIYFDNNGQASNLNVMCQKFASTIHSERQNLYSNKIQFWAIGISGLKDKLTHSLAYKVMVRTGQSLMPYGYTDTQLRNMFRIKIGTANQATTNLLKQKNSVGYVKIKPAG